MHIDFIQEFIDRLRHKIPSLKILVNKKLGYDKKDVSKIHTLVLGSSHFASGFVAQEGEFNFSAPSQDLYYIYNLYKLKNSEYLKNIIVSFSVFTPGHILVKTKQAEYCILYKLLFGIDYQYEDSAIEKKLYKKEKMYQKEINRYIKESSVDYENYLGNAPRYPEDDFREDIIRTVAQRHYKNNQRDNNQMDYSVKLLEETAKNNQNIYFVIPPVTQEYRSYLPDSSTLFKKLYDVCEKFNHVKILNYYDDKNFVHSDFCDGHHLKLIGANKLSQMIRENMKNNEGAENEAKIYSVNNR